MVRSVFQKMSSLTFMNTIGPAMSVNLKNVVEQMLILRQKEVIGIDDLPKRIGRSLFRSTAILNLPDEGYSLEMLEKEAVEIALRRNNGNKAKAAKFLKIPRHTLTYRIEKYNIEDSKKLEE